MTLPAAATEVPGLLARNSDPAQGATEGLPWIVGASALLNPPRVRPKVSSFPTS